MTVTLHAATARLGLACSLAVAGWLTAGCSHHSASGGEGPPQASATIAGQPGGSGTALPPGAGSGGSSGAGAGQAPGQAPGGAVPGQSSAAGGTAASSAAKPPRMPTVVGRNLHDAQDVLHAAGIVFFATTHDLAGQNRPMLLDFHWKVCTQRPAAGQLLAKDTVPDLGIVLTTESCP